VNPMYIFSPLRHVQMRQSGRIVFDLRGGDASKEKQKEISETARDTNKKVTSGFAAADEFGKQALSNQDGLKTGQSLLGQGQQKIRQDIQSIPQPDFDTSGIENRIGSLEGTTRQGFGRVDSQFRGLDNQFRDVGNRLMDVQGDVRGVGNTVETGFAGVGNRFDQMGEQLTDTQTQISDFQTAAGDQFSDLSGNVSQGFSGTNENLLQGFTQQANQLNTGFTNALEGQAALGASLDDMSEKQDTYYGGLAEGQQGIAQQVGGLQSGFSDFRDTYDQNTEIAQQSRADMQEGLENSTNRIRADIGNTADAASANQDRLMSAVSGISRNQERAQREQQASMQGVPRGQQPMESQQPQRSPQFVQRVNRVRQMFPNVAPQLDDQTRQQYSDLIQSFDVDGDFIPASVDANGFQVQRQMDQQGNLDVFRFSRGRAVSRTSMNVPQLLDQASQFDQQQGLMASTSR